MDSTSNRTEQTLGVDVGGTFTDLALWNGEEVVVGKVSSTTDDQSKGVVAGATAIIPSDRRANLLHGTTVATNALLEHRGAKTLLLTDLGFESVIEIARQDRPSLYDAFADRAKPLVDAALRIGIDLTDETSDSDLVRIVDHAIETIGLHDVEAVAICFLNSFQNPTTERRLAAELRSRIDIPISVSSEVVAEFREYERFSTTTLNAFLSPEVATYMGNLGKRAADSGKVDDKAVMRSSGGLISFEHAAKYPSSILLSGPAGGVVATAALGEQMELGTLVSFDMGGTSSDVCRIERGRPEVTYRRDIEGYACLMPSVAVHTVGAGGGSIAWVDDGGALRVGPRSAGAFPGPACYDRGGTEPTVTDANLVLGRLDPNAKLAGTVSLRRDLAIDAFERLGKMISLSATEVAQGVLQVVESHMAHAIRSVSVEQGTDPRDAALVAFGGAGGLHASALAMELGMQAVVVPPYSGVFSAFGLLLSPPRADLAQTVNVGAHEQDKLVSAAELLLAEANAQIEDDGQQVVAESLVVDMRYVGQAHEMSVPYELTDSWHDLCEKYHHLHERHNGFARSGDDVEAVTVRAEAIASASLSWSDLPTFMSSGEQAVRPSREVVTSSGTSQASVFWRPALQPGFVIEGPAVVEEGESTTFIGEGERASVDETGALVITW